MQQLILIRGLPGSGKTTLAMSLDDRFRHFEADMFFETEDGYTFIPSKIKHAHAWCQRMVKGCLEDGLDVVVANTFTRLKELAPYLDMAAECGIIPLIVECKGKFGTVHAVPNATIIKMQERWEKI